MGVGREGNHPVLLTRTIQVSSSLDLEQPVSWAEDGVSTLGVDIHE